MQTHKFVPLGVCALDLIPTTILIGVDINKALITIIIDWGIAIEYNGIHVSNSIVKFEVHA
jgi:hypothetical protein